MSALKVHIIFNPASAGGRTWKRRKLIFSEIKKCWDDFIIEYTEGPGDAVEKTRQAIISGRNLIVAVGGDGTINEVVNGFHNDGNVINPECRLAVINSGTGQGFAQSLGLPKSIRQQFRRVKALQAEKTDIGRITFYAGKHSYFINEFQTGIGGAVVNSVSAVHKNLTRSFTFGLGVLKTINNFSPGYYSFQLDNGIKINDDLTGIVISNGNYTGGGMQLTPDARLNDGYLDVLLIPALTRKEMLSVFPRIYSGKHLKDKRFRCYKIKSLTFSAADMVKSEADGEILNELPLKIEVMPSSLSIIKPCKKERIK